MGGRRATPRSGLGVARATVALDTGDRVQVVAGGFPGNGRGVGDPRVGDGRERVGEIQRARMLSAMAEVAGEYGASCVSVGQVVEHAGVSRRTFYELFDDCQDCLLATFDRGVARASVRVLAAYCAEDSWRARMRCSLAALLQFLEEEPSLGRLLIVEALAAGRPVLERRSLILARMISAIDEGRREPRALAGTGRLTAEGIAGAVLSVLHSRLLEANPPPLAGLLNPLMSMIVLPYLGTSAARHELERVPAEHAHPTTPGPAYKNPLKGLRLRLTYRTFRVLISIASQPGSSNRVIGDASGVNDQGQISKLLARLENHGLIQNTRHTPNRGEPNAWNLTTRGHEVHNLITTNTTTNT